MLGSIYGFVGQSMSGGKSGAAASVQPETAAFLSRFSTPPSDAYKAALNSLIVRLKVAGIYSLLTDLWLTCADAAPDALRNLIAASRDGSIVGAPTYTPLKGFSGLTTSNYLSLPFTGGPCSVSTQFFAAGLSDTTQAAQNVLGGANNYGGIRLSSGGTGPWGLFHSIDNNGALRSDGSIAGGSFVQGWQGGSAYSASLTGRTTGTSASGAVATPALINNIGGSNVIQQLSAFGYCMNGALTGAQFRKLLSYITAFLDDISALG